MHQPNILIDYGVDQREDGAEFSAPQEDLNDQVNTQVERVKTSSKYPHGSSTLLKLRKGNVFIRDPQIEYCWRSVQEIHSRLMSKYTVMDTSQGIASGVLEFEQISTSGFQTVNPLQGQASYGLGMGSRSRELLRLSGTTGSSAIQRHLQLLHALTGPGADLPLGLEMDENDDLGSVLFPLVC
eukprot:GABU01008956.1.p1 GENE.GABU01008956.1~~GABU01008956.1.p1  ORF type:complete len:191 (+),score=37.25 GABU01008956.1:27-575(+)